MKHNTFPSRLRPIAGLSLPWVLAQCPCPHSRTRPIRTNGTATAGQEIKAISRKNIENAIEFDPRVVDSRGVRDKYHRRKSE